MDCDDGDVLHVAPGIRYHPDVVAQSILYAAQYPVRELIVGDFGRLVVWVKLSSPLLIVIDEYPGSRSV